MTIGTQKTTRNDWTRRIIILLRRADARQLREIYYINSGYLSAVCPPPPMACTPPLSDGGAADQIAP